jgi:hypothetical protein
VIRTKTPHGATPVTSPTTMSPTLRSSKRDMRSPSSSAGSQIGAFSPVDPVGAKNSSGL